MWKTLIEDLLQKGLKEQEIADRLKAKGVRTTQATVNRIKSGSIAEPRYKLGAALIALHDAEMGTGRKVKRIQEARA